MNHWAILVIAFVASGTCSPAAPLDFRFPDDISWKSVFDRGFRPKHVSGLEHTNAECIDQEVNLYFGGGLPFRLDRGRVVFELQIDESLRIVEHVSRVPVTMEEGKRRFDLFHEMFDGNIIKQGVMPPIVEPEYGRVMTISDQAAIAEVDGLIISFRFTSAMNPRTPLIPMLMISKKYSMKDPQLPTRRKTVEPPQGYEWYSLDPRVDTPAPGVPPVIKPAVVPPGLVPGSPHRRPDPRDAEAGRQGKRLILNLTAAVVCFLLLPLLCLLWMIRKKAAASGGS
jgi:hypothetical protein